MIQKIKEEQAKKDKKDIFNDDEDFTNGKQGDEMFNEMRETRTGFGAKVKKEFNPGQHNAEGGLQPEDDDEEEDEDVEDDGDDGDDGEEGVDVDEDEDAGSDHDF